MVPEEQPALRWESKEDRREPIFSDERLDPRPDGTAPLAKWISKVRPQVGRRTPQLVLASFTIRVPEGGEVWIPMRFKADSDDLADDDPEVVLDGAVRVVHRTL